MVKHVGNYVLGDTIGHGSFGKVKLGMNKLSGEKVALKIIQKNGLEHQKAFQQVVSEIAAMKELKHKNIVELKEVLHSKRHIYLVMELCTGGDLFEKIIKSNSRRLSENQARVYFQQLMNGMMHCHSRGICHRDLKPENLLLNSDGVIKVSDFGLSNFMNDEKPLKTRCGTRYYVPPEVLLRQGYDGASADIWSCGVVLFVMLAGAFPFDDEGRDNDAILFDRIKQGQRKDFPSWFTQPAKNLISKMLVVDPRKRMTLRDLLDDEWFLQGYVPSQEAKDLLQPPEQVHMDILDVNSVMPQVESSAPSASGSGWQTPSANQPKKTSIDIQALAAKLVNLQSTQ